MTVTPTRSVDPGTHFGGPAAPLRLLLIGDPEEFDPHLDWDAEESDRDYMRRLARTVVEADGGRGADYLSAEEYNRIVAVWIHGERRPPVRLFSPATYAEVRRTETMLLTRSYPWR